MAKNVKITTIPSVLDLIAPHSCMGCGRLGEILCDRCKNYILEAHRNVCPNCKSPKTGATCENCPELAPIYALGPREDLLNDLIHAYKYESVRVLASKFAEILDGILPEDLPEETVIVPLPTSTKHIRERGQDHTLLLAKKLARRRGWRVEKALTRAKNTVQVGASAAERRAQAGGAYALEPRFRPDAEATYLLLDDVWTTGASMRAAYEVFTTSGAKNIQMVILAYSGREAKEAEPEATKEEGESEAVKTEAAEKMGEKK